MRSASNIGISDGSSDLCTSNLLDLQSKKQVDDSACAFVEAEITAQRLAPTVTRRVDEHDAMAADEVCGLRRPHAAVHHQARPEHDRRAVTADTDLQRAERRRRATR